MAVKGLKNESKIWLAIILVAAMIICGFVFWKTCLLQDEQEKLDNQLNQIRTQIEYEKRQNQAISNEIKYRQTDDYIEDQARDIFGLRDSDETIFKPGNENSLENGK